MERLDPSLCDEFKAQTVVLRTTSGEQLAKAAPIAEGLRFAGYIVTLDISGDTSDGDWLLDFSGGESFMLTSLADGQKFSCTTVQDALQRMEK